MNLDGKGVAFLISVRGKVKKRLRELEISTFTPISLAGSKHNVTTQ